MNKYGILFKVCRKIKYFFARKISVPEKREFISPCVYIGHHQNMYGPINFMTFCPVDVRMWVYNMFLNKTDCYDQFYNYTFNTRYKINPVLSKIYAKALSFFIPKLLNSMHALPVYRINSLDMHNIYKTIQDSVDALINNERVVIFPDIDYTSKEPYTGRLYSGFAKIDKLYFQKTGKHVDFIPVYISKSKKKMILGEKFSILEDDNNSLKQIAKTMQEGLNCLAAECSDI